MAEENWQEPVAQENAFTDSNCCMGVADDCPTPQVRQDGRCTTKCSIYLSWVEDCEVRREIEGRQRARAQGIEVEY